MNRFKRKLHCCKGFSMAETLAAVLIILLVSSVVAAGMPAARNAYYRVTESANAQVYLSTTLMELRNELSTATEIKIKDSGSTVSYVNPVTGDSMISLKTANGKNYLAITTYIDYEGVNYNDPNIKKTKERPLISNGNKTAQSLSIRLKQGSTLFQYSNGVLTVGPFDVLSSVTGSAVASLPTGGYSIGVLVPTP